jgi:hypothetical protein
MNLKETITTKLIRRTHLVDKAINNLLPNMYPCYYNSSDHFVAGVLDEIIWFLVDIEELQGIERIDIENYIIDFKYDELTEFFNERCIVLKNDNLQETIKKVLREELYSPAGDEHIPDRFVVHKSNPVWRENIEFTGLQTSVGECYQQHIGGDVECKESIFATDSLNKKDMFDSTYDDDIWLIDTECAEVTWYKDRHFDNGDYKHHIVTFENISPDCLKLIHKGTGKSW